MSTETADPRFRDIENWPMLAAVTAMLEGQLAAIAALLGEAAPLAAAAEAAAERLHGGGRLVYVGAGTSGRVAVQDGVELYPTYNWPPDRLIFLMAGGLTALTESQEGSEDDADGARQMIAEHRLGADDVVIGVAASGRTPFTIAAIEAARTAGALTIAVANNPGSPLAHAAEHAILAVTGAEVIAGSTRMKAGTAQKAALNVLSTAIMIRLGRVYRGLMVDMRISNDKLRARGEAMVAELAGVDLAAASTALVAAGDDIRTAILVAQGARPEEARNLLAEGTFVAALAALRTQAPADA